MVSLSMKTYSSLCGDYMRLRDASSLALDILDIDGVLDYWILFISRLDYRRSTIRGCWILQRTQAFMSMVIIIWCSVMIHTTACEYNKMHTLSTTTTVVIVVVVFFFSSW